MQAQPAFSVSWAAWLAIMVIGGLVLIFAFILVLVLMNMAQRRREWEHTERLKAQERGESIPLPHSEWARAWVCLGVGAGVPIAAFLFTALAAVSQKFDEGIWLAPAVVGGMGVYYGYCLASRLFTGEAPDEEYEDEGDGEEEGGEEEDQDAEAKPDVDADAIDVVGRRGV